MPLPRKMPKVASAWSAHAEPVKRTRYTAQPMTDMPRHPRPPGGPYHAFWLFHAGERARGKHADLFERTDATVRISDDLVQQVVDRLRAMPTRNPARELAAGHGLNLHGVTLIEDAAGAVL